LRGSDRRHKRQTSQPTIAYAGAASNWKLGTAPSCWKRPSKVFGHPLFCDPPTLDTQDDGSFHFYWASGRRNAEEGPLVCAAECNAAHHLVTIRQCIMHRYVYVGECSQVGTCDALEAFKTACLTNARVVTNPIWR
jgi:hypothetical protein